MTWVSTCAGCQAYGYCISPVSSRMGLGAWQASCSGVGSFSRPDMKSQNGFPVNTPYMYILGKQKTWPAGMLTGHFQCFISVAEPKLFIFGAGFIFPPYFGSCSSSSHKLPLKKCTLTVILEEICLNGGRNTFFFILASLTLTAVHIYSKYNFCSGSRSEIISAPPAPAPQHWFKLLYNLK